MTNTRSVTDPPLCIDKAHWYEEMIIFFSENIFFEKLLNAKTLLAKTTRIHFDE